MLQLAPPSPSFWNRWYGAQQIALLSGDVAMEVFTLGELDRYTNTCRAQRREIHEALEEYILRHRLRHYGGEIELDSLLKTMFTRGESRSRDEAVHTALDAHIRRRRLERGI